jgi:hypothetical protein
MVGGQSCGGKVDKKDHHSLWPVCCCFSFVEDAYPSQHRYNHAH